LMQKPLLVSLGDLKSPGVANASCDLISSEPLNL
jgi:hypothetical protein